MVTTTWTRTGLDEDDLRTVEAAWEEYERVLEGRVAQLDAGPDALHVAVTRDGGDTADWSVDLVAYLPGDVLVGSGEATTFDEALTGADEQLAAEIDRAVEQPTREVRGRSGWQAVDALLAACKREEDSRAFFALLRPLIRSFSPMLHREVALLEMEDRIPEGAVESAGLLDEAMLRAWDQFPQRRSDQSLAAWLAGLIEQVLDEAAERPEQRSLDERREMLPREPHGGVEPAADDREPDDQPSYFADLPLAEILPGESGTDRWDRLRVEERQTGLARALSQLHPLQRRTLMYATVEGFDAADIADIQGRPQNAVETDLTESRRVLTEQLEGDEAVLEATQREIEQPGGRDQRRRRR